MTLAEAEHSKLADDFAGEIIVPTDPSYDEARTIFNAMIDKRPAVIAQCETNNDVARAIRFARERGLEIAVRGGGHGVAGKALSEGGLVVDLRRMNSVTVDPDARTATVAGGATMSHLDRATEPHGLATTGGRVSTTGVAGLTLGGGNGWLDRKLGLACDNLLSVELVTTDGKTIRASDDAHPELFWALHGGGGNFGVVTEFEFRLYPLPVVTAALLMWPAEAGPEVVGSYRDFIESAPDEICGALVYMTGPPEDFVPSQLQGNLMVIVLIVYTGGEDQARKAMAPMLGYGHHGEMVAEMPYAELQCMLDDPPGHRNYWSATYLDSLPDEAVDVHCARAADMIVPSHSQHALAPQCGAVARGRVDYPVPWRNAPWYVLTFGMWEEPSDDDRGRRWAQQTRADLAPWATDSVYLNFIGDEGADRIVAGLGAENYNRLAKVKTEYDPDNLFHLNHNIKPG
jgi:FAD/FMN-containing dehydrogenase